jgi:DNA repair protein RecO (recombination protein O)
MPLHSADALILRTYKLAEADRIVVFLTSDRGKKRGVAKGARRTKSAFVGALEPLTQVRVAYFEREQRELVGLNYAEPSCSPLSAGSVEVLGCAAYFADLIDEWAADADADERLYRLGVSMVEALTAGVPAEPLARYFEYWLLRLQGVYPPHLVCRHCGESLGDRAMAAYLAAGGHAFTCARCASEAIVVEGMRKLSPGALEFLQAARRLAPRQLGELAVPEAIVRELESVHRVLIRQHLEREPRSMKVLREVRRAWQ